jgi:hypothetical protein
MIGKLPGHQFSVVKAWHYLNEAVLTRLLPVQKSFIKVRDESA